MVQNLVDLNGFNEKNNTATPLFWHIPKAAGSTIKRLTAYCLRLAVASEGGRNFSQEDTIRVIEKGRNGPRYVNVDLSTSQGILRARDMGFVGSGLADIVVSMLLPDVVENLFDDHTSQGLLFTVFRHPVDREVSMYYYLQIAGWEKTYTPGLKNMTIVEYTQSNQIVDNWMTRMLTGEWKNTLNWDHYKHAHWILKTKTVVGIFDELEASLRRFGRLFGWDRHGIWNQCVQSYTKHGSNSNKHPKIYKGSADWDALAKANEYDIQLYEYATRLFENQTTYFMDQ